MLLRGTSSLSLEGFMPQRMPHAGQGGREPVRGEVAASASVHREECTVQVESQEPEAPVPAPECEPPDVPPRRGRGRGRGKGRGRGRAAATNKVTKKDDDDQGI